jgi:hypothetical protein
MPPRAGTVLHISPISGIFVLHLLDKPLEQLSVRNARLPLGFIAGKLCPRANLPAP